MDYLIINLLYNSFIVISTLFAGTGLAVFFVSLVYNFDNLEEKEEEEQLSLYQKICQYEQKHFDDFNQLEYRKLTDNELEELGNAKIEEETPLGPIIMTYDPKAETFLYYCDNKSSTYKMLDSTAQLFAIKFDCKQVCVDYKKEWDKGKAAAIEQKLADDNEEESLKNKQQSEEEEEEEEEKSVFAKFKSYNIIKNRTQNDSNNSNKQYHIYTEKSNRFTYKGRISEFVQKEEVPPPKNNLSFKEYKTLFGSSTKLKNS